MPRLEVRKLRRFRSQPSGSHEVRYDCPICGNAEGKLYVNFKKQQWICFACDESGSISDRDATMVVDTGPAFIGEALREFSWETYPDIRGSGKQYCLDHNIDVDVARQWGVRSGKGDAASRLIIPCRYITITEGRTVLFRVAHATLKTIVPKEIQSGKRKPLILSVIPEEGRLLGLLPPYDTNLNLPAHHQDRTAIIVEGAADAFRLLTGIYHCDDTKLQRFISIVCLWGKHLDEETTFQLTRTFKHFYVLLDREERKLARGGETSAGIKIQHALNALSEGYVSRHAWGETDIKGADPAELNHDDCVKVLNMALKRTGG